MPVPEPPPCRLVDACGSVEYGSQHLARAEDKFPSSRVRALAWYFTGDPNSRLGRAWARDVLAQPTVDVEQAAANPRSAPPSPRFEAPSDRLFAGGGSGSASTLESASGEGASDSQLFVSPADGGGLSHGSDGDGGSAATEASGGAKSRSRMLESGSSDSPSHSPDSLSEDSDVSSSSGSSSSSASESRDSSRSSSQPNASSRQTPGGGFPDVTDATLPTSDDASGESQTPDNDSDG